MNHSPVGVAGQQVNECDLTIKKVEKKKKVRHQETENNTQLVKMIIFSILKNVFQNDTTVISFCQRLSIPHISFSLFYISLSILRTVLYKAILNGSYVCFLTAIYNGWLSSFSILRAAP